MSPVTELAIWIIGAGVAAKAIDVGWLAFKAYQARVMQAMALEVRYEGAREAVEVMLDRLSPAATPRQRDEVIQEVIETMRKVDAATFKARADAKATAEAMKQPGSWT